MKSKYIIGILIVGVIGFFTITSFYGEAKNNDTEISKSIIKDEELQSVDNTQKSGAAELPQNPSVKSFKPSEEIKVFNAILSENFRPDGTRSPISFDELRKIAGTDLETASKMINELAENPKKNLLALLALNYECSGLFASETQLDVILENRPFEKALWNSGYCARFGTETDPFFDYLQLARKGDKQAQLILGAELYRAIDIGAINLKTNPIEYNDLRNEVLGYLKSLSTQGVGLASLKLRNEYMSDGGFFSTDRVLSVFYLSLYEKQHKVFQDYPWNTCFTDSDFCKSPDELYQGLTKIEKARADRMLERISQ